MPLLACLAVAGCYRADSAPVVRPAEDKPVAVTRPVRQNLTRTIDLSGQVEGIEQSPIYVKIAGYVSKLNVDIGDRVKKGDIVAELWIPETLDELKQKEASVAQAAAEVTQSQKLLKVAEASVARAQANLSVSEATRKKAAADYVRWKADFDRSKQLLAKDAVSSQEFEQITNQLHTAEAAELETEAGILAAKAALLESQAQRDKSESDVEVARSRQGVAQTDLERQRTLVDYAHVRAPFDGVITKRNLHVGHLLQPTGAQESNGLSIFHIARIDPVRVFVDVPEGDAILVKPGTKATVLVPANQEREFAGTVVRTSWALDATSHTLRAEIQVPNPDGELRPGMYVIGQIAATASNALTVPASAVFVRDDQAFVVRVEEGKAVLMPVKAGRRQGSVIILLKKQTTAPAADGRVRWDDFDGNETLVVESPAAYVDGQAIRVAGAGDPSAKNERTTSRLDQLMDSAGRTHRRGTFSERARPRRHHAERLRLAKHLERSSDFFARPLGHSDADGRRFDRFLGFRQIANRPAIRRPRDRRLLLFREAVGPHLKRLQPLHRENSFGTRRRQQVDALVALASLDRPSLRPIGLGRLEQRRDRIESFDGRACIPTTGIERLGRRLGRERLFVAGEVDAEIGRQVRRLGVRESRRAQRHRRGQDPAAQAVAHRAAHGTFPP